jgi:starvation-inducible DNA-binding protein
VHWNVVGPDFIAIHLMLDPQVDAVRGLVDSTAERIATLGGSPSGTPGALVSQRSFDDSREAVTPWGPAAPRWTAGRA